tara:strand:+ start:133 stop:357 length:225 start_codon:yes stop_codon:yes gene_type:complete
MKNYIYYNRLDPNKEPLGKIQAESLNEAIELASQIKKLEKDAFLSTFKVTEYEKKETVKKTNRPDRKRYQYTGK